MKINEILREVRKQKGFSQEQVAEYLSIDTSNYGRIERGQSSISIDRIEKLAKLYKISIPELINEDAKKEATVASPQISSIVENSTDLFIKHLKEEVIFLRELLKAKDSQIAYFIDTNKENAKK